VIGPRGRDLIRKAEGLRLDAYVCPAGKPTIGYGHTRGVCLGTSIVEAEAERLLHEDLAEAEATVDQHVIVPLTESMRDALASFVFNLGRGKFRISTMLRRLNEGKYELVPHELERWIYGRKDGALVEMPGLMARRKAEAALFLADGIPTKEA